IFLNWLRTDVEYASRAADVNTGARNMKGTVRYQRLDPRTVQIAMRLTVARPSASSAMGKKSPCLIFVNSKKSKLRAINNKGMIAADQNSMSLTPNSLM